MSWIESEFNQNILSQGCPFWSCLERQRYSRYNNEYENDALKFIPGVWPIKSYLDYYYDHIQKVVKNVPNENLMVVNTFSISDKKKEILKFAGVKGEVGTISKDHSNKRSKKLSIYKLVRKKEIVDIILSHKCINMLENKYPSILKDTDYT
ncbi:hypothetical protein GGP52_003064 [Salinibacter ruber]|nr:hypothetical protein [Salinibacter ruber]